MNIIFYNIGMLLVNLYKVPLKRKITQADIANATGLSIGTVNKLFKNEPHDFKFSSVEKIAKFLGCKALDIIIEVPDDNE